MMTQETVGPPTLRSRVLLIVNRPDIFGRLDCPQCITGDTFEGHG